MDTLSIQELRSVNAAGGLKGVALVAQGAAFLVQIAQVSGKIALLRGSSGKDPRGFTNPLQAFKLLKKVGLTVGSFDVRGWNPDVVEGKAKRPDRAEALRRMHERYREEVEASLREADDPDTEWVSGVQVKANMAAERERLLARIKEQEG